MDAVFAICIMVGQRCSDWYYKDHRDIVKNNVDRIYNKLLHNKPVIDRANIVNSKTQSRAVFPLPCISISN